MSKAGTYLLSTLIFLFSQPLTGQEIQKAKGYLVYTDGAYYFLPTQEHRKAIQRGFCTENLGLGFQLRALEIDIDSLRFAERPPSYRKENFPDDFLEAHNHIWILPVKIWYQEKKIPIPKIEKELHEEWRYTVIIEERRIDYVYNQRATVVKKIKVLPYRTGLQNH